MMQAVIRTEKRKLVEALYLRFLEGGLDNLGFLEDPDLLYDDSEIDAMDNPTRQVFFSPFANRVVYIPLEKLDLGSKRDRMLLTVVLHELRLKAPESDILRLYEAVAERL